MNEKLKEFSEQAWKYASEYDYAASDTGIEFNNVLEQKFAELIVRECAELANDSHDGDPYYHILKHFGIE